MGKIGFNCQLFLSEIGSTTDSSHSTWFHKTVLHEEDFAQHVLFDTEPSQDDTDRILLLAPKILPFPKELEKELSFSVYFLRFRCYRGLYAIDRIISDHIDIPSTQHRSSKGSRRPTKARKPGSFRKWIPIRRVHNRMDKLTLTHQFGIRFGIFLGRYREGIGME
ncbi:hypothetical protein F8388_004502 [Cannabis sativa]|uniref:Uncharacterized protein n=1 Tax=Cannabis sativa TaxID=3483 RepID=A0A7J6ENS2_CANSA|nr:hypothetical protein F8388_004502 [Cannabis sativa]